MFRTETQKFAYTFFYLSTAKFEAIYHFYIVRVFWVKKKIISKSKANDT